MNERLTVMSIDLLDEDRPLTRKFRLFLDEIDKAQQREVGKVDGKET
ncbi:hypothetical protein WGT02_25080 (plasmid) [Rhizobium sp. T1470]|nr:hypothetical protein [Rhizobium sp. T1473]MCA0805752.1 hypothetical protein [Rhizobium sp. T1473]